MNIISIHEFKTTTNLSLPLVSTRIPAGFPSPADDFIEAKLDLNEYLVKHPAATFFVRVSGDSMKDVGIFTDDILIVDRSLDPQNGSIIIAALDGELTVKRLKKEGTTVLLYPENQNYQPIVVTQDRDFAVWGVVVYVIHKPTGT